MLNNAAKSYPGLEVKQNSDSNQASAAMKEITQQMRLGFIRKVYGILLVQLTLTVGLSSLGFIESFKIFLINNSYFVWIFFAIAIVTLLVLACFEGVARKVPLNYILLFLFTIAESMMICYAVAVSDWKIVLTAALLTLAVTIGLTIYACVTTTDFTWMGGLLFIGAILLVLLGLFSWLFGSFLHTLYCVLGVFVFGVYLIYDTQLIMGKFGKAYSIDDYVFAALNIYLDIINMFMMILSLLGGRN